MKSQNFEPEPKNGPILLKFGVINSFHELISHTKYEQNRTIFDKVEN